jgi:ATP-dependent Clp protease ATP-binding subunit ClpA
MLQRLKLRLRDMATIKALCEAAERHAQRCGEPEPGAEHFLLSALELQDGTAQRAFERAGADPNGLCDAIAAQYEAALRSVGLDPATLHAHDNDPDVVPPTRNIYDAQPSGQAVMQALAARKQEDKDEPLLGAHVVTVIAAMKLGVAARALRTMGVDPETLATAASNEIKRFRA